MGIRNCIAHKYREQFLMGGVLPMMNWGFGNMMGGFGGFSFFALLIQLVLLIDLILVGIWLWQKINTKK